MTIVEPARLSWRDGAPYATPFADIYHGADGMAEVERVFLAPARFDELLAGRPERLLVGELGFGTGLNFAVVAEACGKARVPLHFVSVDAAPLAAADFERVARQRAASLPVYAELIDAYPPLLSGWHQRSLADGRITLSLYWGDVAEALEQLAAEQRSPFDLWLLDGFAPDRNPAMWTQALFARLAAVSRRGTRVSTFTAAGRVRRALTEVGFAMRRVDQQPHKRESLAGELAAPGLAPWPRPARVNVIGAGIAGASLARHLADAGIAVRVHERRAVAAGASAIPATVLHARLLADDSPAAALRAHAYLYASRFCARFCGPAAGAVQVPSGSYPAARLETVAGTLAPSGPWLELLSRDESAALTGLPLTTPTLHFPGARIIATPALCRALLDHPGIELKAGTRIAAWPEEPTVLACAADCRSFSGAAYLELAEVGGQVDVYGPEHPALARASLAVVGNGYLAPGHKSLVVGATYEYQPWPAARARATNRAHLERLAGTTAAGSRWLAAARGSRCVSSDRTAIAGELFTASGEAQPLKLVSTGHGSMGAASSHYCAALLTARLLGDFQPLTPALGKLLSPLRFRERQARRGYRLGASD